MKRQLLTVGAVLVSFLFWYHASSPGQEPKEEVKNQARLWMKTKTQLSSNIRNGIAEANFGQIEANARALNATTLLEALVPSKRPEVNRQIQWFTFANNELVRQCKPATLPGPRRPTTSCTTAA